MISKRSCLLFVAIVMTMLLTLPATADDVIQGWFRERNDSQNKLTITARDRSRMEFDITPNTKFTDADDKELKDGIKSKKLWRGVKIVVTAISKGTEATRVKLEKWR